MTLEQERRRSDRERLDDLFKFVSDMRYAVKDSFEAQDTKLSLIEETIRRQSEILAIPTRDVPTVEELLAEAKTDSAKRALLQNTLAELEFESVEVEYP